MAVLAVAAAGAAIGGGTAFALGAAASTIATAVSLGWAVGSVIGNYAFGPRPAGPQDQYFEGPRLAELVVRGGSYGLDIPEIWGHARMGGAIIWKQPLREERVSTTTIIEGGNGGKGGKGGGGGSASSTQVSFYYYGTWAVALCEGIAAVRRIWLNSKLAWHNNSGPAAPYVSIYYGDPNQLPDPTMEVKEGVGNVPGYRGITYLVFNDMPIQDFGNSLPNCEAEVCRTDSRYNRCSPAGFDGETFVSGPGKMAHYEPGATIQEGRWWFMVIQYVQPGDGFTYIEFRRQIRNYDNVVVESTPWVRSLRAWKGDQIGQQSIMVFEGGLVAMAFDDATVGDKYFEIFDAEHLLVSSKPWTSSSQPKTGDNNGRFFGDVAGRYHYITYVANTAYRFCYLTPVVDLNGAVIDFLDNFYVNDIADTLPGTPGFAEIYKDYAGRWWLLQFNGGGNMRYLWRYETNEGTIGYQHELEQYSNYICWGDFSMVGNCLVAIYRPDGIGMSRIVYYNIDESVLSEWPITGSNPGLDNTQNIRFLTNCQDGYIHGDISAGSFANNVWAAVFSLFCADAYAAEIIEDTCIRSGLAANEIDVSLMTERVPGYIRTGTMAGRSVIAPLQNICRFDAIESQGKLRFQPVCDGVGETGLTVLEEDLGVRQYGGEAPEIFQLRRVQELELPREVRVVFSDQNQDYDSGLHRAFNPVTQSNSVLDITMPAVLTAQQAKQIAQRFLDVSGFDRISATFAFGIKHLQFEPGDVFDVETSRGTYRVRLVSAQLSPVNVIECSASVYDAESFVQDADADDTPGPIPLPTIIASDAILLDIPVLRVEHAVAPGIYAAGYADEPIGSDPWPGANLYHQVIAGWQLATYWSEGMEASYGNVQTPLGYVEHPWQWDDTSELIVQMVKGTLASASEEDVQSGAENQACVGIHGRWEVIGFVNVEDQGNSIYRLTRFLRARRGTELQVGTGQVSDQFVLLDDIGVRYGAHPQELIGVEWNWRVVAENDRIALTADKPFTSAGVSSTPFAPVRIEGTRADGNLTIKWTPRSRCSIEQYMGETYPSCEDEERYHVEIRPQGGTLVLRTVVVDAAHSLLYTIEAYRADSGDSGATVVPTVDVTVYQISATVGRGYPGSATI